MANQVPAVVCVACGKPVFFCKAVGRDFLGAAVVAEDFVPIGDHPQPESDDFMICPLCDQPFALHSVRGGVILKLEDDSWWPHPPI